MTSFKDIVDVIDGLWLCDSAQSVFEALDRYGKSLGFDCAAVIPYGRRMNEGMAQPKLWVSADEGCLNHYLNQDYLKIDPILPMAMRSTAPFQFSEAYAAAKGDVDEFKAEAKNFGVEFGWGVPVNTSDAVPGVIYFAGKTKIELSSSQQYKIFTVSVLAFNLMSGFLGPMATTMGITLTNREREILTLVAQGKTNWETGTILSISEYSVRDYLKGLSVKLNTSNRAHTVARAMQLGLVHPAELRQVI